MGFFDSIASVASSVASVASGPLQAVIAQTPIAPFAGAIGSIAKGDWAGAANAGIKLGVEALVQATPLGDIPVVGQIASTEAANIASNALGIHASAQVKTAAAGAVAPAQNVWAAAMKTPLSMAMAAIGQHVPAPAPTAPAPARPRTPPPPPPRPAPPVSSTSNADAFGSPVVKKPAMGTATQTLASQTAGIVKPYGKVFATRSAWEAFAARPETAGGTIGFP